MKLKIGGVDKYGARSSVEQANALISSLSSDNSSARLVVASNAMITRRVFKGGCKTNKVKIKKKTILKNRFN